MTSALVSFIWYTLWITLGAYLVAIATTQSGSYAFGCVVGGFAAMGRQIIREAWEV